MTIQKFLKSYSTARIQIGTRNMSYIDKEKMFIVYDIREPNKGLCKWYKFDQAWKKLTEER